MTQSSSLPQGMYRLSPDERRQVEGMFAGPFPTEQLYDRDLFGGWRVLHSDKRGDGSARVLVRSPNGAMVWAEVNRDDEVVSGTIVEGEEARRLDIEYGVCFHPAEKQRLAAELRPGVAADAALRNLYGGKLERVGLLDEHPTPDGGVERTYRVYLAGVLTVDIASDGKLRGYRLLERQAAVDRFPRRG